MELVTTATGVLDKIPGILELFRNAIMKLIEMLNLPVNSGFLIFAGIIALVFSYLWIKQFVIAGWGKISTLLNFILLAIVFYLVIVYV